MTAGQWGALFLDLLMLTTLVGVARFLWNEHKVDRLLVQESARVGRTKETTTTVRVFTGVYDWAKEPPAS